MRLLAIAFGLFVLFGSAVLAQSPVPRFGQHGDPVHLSVGFQPFFTPTWSGVILHAKQLWRRHLPAGSTVTWVGAMQGSLLSGQLATGHIQLAYLGDRPAVAAIAQPHLADVRMIAVTGLSRQLCAILLVRNDAPPFHHPLDALRWLEGKRLATPFGSCAERATRHFNAAARIKPARLVNIGPTNLRDAFDAKTIDAAVVWQPHAAALVQSGHARIVATGADFDISDAAFLVIRNDFMTQRPDITRGWVEAELEAQAFLSNPDNAAEIAEIVSAAAKGLGQGVAWAALYGDGKADEAHAERLTLPFALSSEVRTLVDATARSLYDERVTPVELLRPDAVRDEYARDAMSRLKMDGAIGRVLARPAPIATKD